MIKKINGCRDCPFSSIVEYYCELENKGLLSEDDNINLDKFTGEPISPYPNWCPLIKQSVIIELNTNENNITKKDTNS